MLILLALTQTDKAFCLFLLSSKERPTALQAVPQQSKSPLPPLLGLLIARSHAVEQVQRQPVLVVC